ncbi:unnamed protein product [Heterobilharzia americana]|nr:unnamed protein product [Heterobilharzia americana]
MQNVLIKYRQSISINLVICCFLVYRITESLLQYGNRINISSTVCKALTSQLNQSTHHLCHYKKKNESINIVENSQAQNYSNITRINEDSTEYTQDLIQIKIQYLTGIYLLIYRILLNIPAMISCFFYGSLAHKISHKFIMLVPCIGSILACSFFIAGLSPELKLIPDTIILTLIGATLYGTCGKSSAFSMGANSYISKNSIIQDRTCMLARLLGMNFFGLSLGTLLLGVFYRFSNYFELILFVIIGDVFTIILVFSVGYSKENDTTTSSTASKQSSTTLKAISEVAVSSCSSSLPSSTLPTRKSPAQSKKFKWSYGNETHFPGDCNPGKNDGKKESPSDYEQHTPCGKRIFFEMVKPFITLKSSYIFLFKERDNNKRVYLLTLLGTILFKQMAKSGEQDVMLLYLTNESSLLWSAELYAYYQSCYYTLMFIQLIILLPILERKFAFRDTTLILFGLTTEIVRLLITGLLKNTIGIFISAVIGSSACFITSCTRSLISKLVNSDEINASFALISILETLANLIGSGLFTLIYNNSLTFYSSFIFILDAALNIPIVVIFIWLRYKLTCYEVCTSQNQQS